jgi:hypothetical protein
MHGAQTKESGTRKVCTIMRLRGNESAASTYKPGWQAFSEREVPLIVGAGSQSSRLPQLATASKQQCYVAPLSMGALTSGSSGPANSPLRYAFAVH